LFVGIFEIKCLPFKQPLSHNEDEGNKDNKLKKETWTIYIHNRVIMVSESFRILPNINAMNVVANAN